MKPQLTSTLDGPCSSVHSCVFFVVLVFAWVFDGFVPRSFGLFVFLVVAVVLVVRRNSATSLGDNLMRSECE